MRIGFIYACFAAASYTQGSAITYTGGKEICKTISATYTENRRDNPAYASDVQIESDKGMTDYTVAFSGDDILPADKVPLLGWTEVKTGDTVTGYEINDVEPPYVGFGYIRKLRVNHVNYYEAKWCRLIQFTEDAITDNTKKKELEWGETAITGTGIGVYTDATDTVRFTEEMRFSSYTEALTWLKGKANITD